MRAFSLIAVKFGFLLLLASCGGSDGFQPSVSQIQATTLRYGQEAVILVAGQYMRSDMVAETGTCTGPAFRADSGSQRAILTCQVTSAGPLTITIRAANGERLHSATLMVPLPRVLLATSLGNVELELNPLAAPITVNNFLGYVNSGFYRNTLFHRAIAGFVVQGGGYTKGLVKKDGQKTAIVLESNVGLQNTRGTVAMARTSELNSATSEFYVNLSDNASLDYLSPSLPGYAVFGKVLSGMDVIDSIAALPTANVGINENVPTTDVTINFALQTQ
jgi:peptidyl-prolyl cis-trans isomerase A (cyclophilin A)